MLVSEMLETLKCECLPTVTLALSQTYYELIQPYPRCRVVIPTGYEH